MKDVVEIIDKGDVAAYSSINDMLKEDLQRKAEKETAQAPEVYKVAVTDTVNHLCEAMDNFQETEKETVVSPLTWKQYVKNNKEAIDKSLSDLGTLVGETATDAKEAITHQAEKVFELTEKAVKSLEDAAGFFHRAKESLLERDRNVKESMKRIQEIMVDLNEMSQKEMSDEAKDSFAKMQRESMEMLKHFQELYDAAHQPTGKMVPGKIAEMFDVASTSIKGIHDDLKICAYMKKAAVKEQASSVFNLISKTAGKVVSRAKGYMKTLKAAKDKIYNKGKDISDKLQHLKPMLVVGFGDDRDMKMGKYIGNVSYQNPTPNLLAEMIVKEMMKDGLGKTEILDNLTRLGKTIKDAASDKKTLEMIDGKDAAR